jgi:flagellar hook-length control protein FliK
MPGLTAVAARANSGGKETGPAAVDVDDGSPDRFAAHFQRLIGQQAGGRNHAETQARQANPGTPGETPIPELLALLPFIEALGLNPASAAAPATDMPTAIPETLALPADVAAESSLLGAPAISAANPAPQGETRGLPFNLAVQTTGAAAPNEDQTVPGSILAVQRAPMDDLSAGREFSAQLVAAIGASKEQAPVPGNMAAAVQQVIASHSPAASPGANHADPVVARPVGSSGWTEEIGNHVVWLANRSESRAELVLTPPQMGRVEVSLTVKGDQAVASFVSGNPVVREALEAALPRLREVLAEAGIQLGQANVNAENARQWAQQDKHGDNSASDPARANPGDAAVSPVSSGSLSTSPGLKGGRGLVDVFA